MPIIWTDFVSAEANDCELVSFIVYGHIEVYSNVSQKFFTVLVLRLKRDVVGSYLETGVYGAESELSASILGKQFAQQR